MISIKNSFANCSVCDLLEAPSCILETNCEDDLRKVDIIFIAENPGKEEVNGNPPRPLIGKAGKMFRKYFQKYGLNKLNYLLTNVVLCQTLNEDGTTGNPEQNVIDLCKENCMNIIKRCDPKLVVLMGASPMSAFGFKKSGITVIHEKGEILEWEGYKFRVIVHPSFVNRNSATWEPKFEKAFADIAEMMGGKHIDIMKEETKSLGKGIFRYKIPSKFYTTDYRLVDIQFLTKTQQVLYIFRDKDNNKVFHKESDRYICYQIPNGVVPKKIISYDELNQIEIKYKDRYNVDPDITYEGDLKITTKHAMDYYHFNQGEAKKTKTNVMFFDIEIDTGDERVFPQPTEALFPINMITTIFNGYKICYVVDNKTEPITKKEVDDLKIFKNEKSMMQEFIKDYKKSDPDFISGWNCVYKNEFLYLNDRIVQLKNASRDKQLSIYGNINDVRETGNKIPYKIKLYNGVEIITSENHIFPYFKLNKDKYYTNDKILSCSNETKLKNIMKDIETNLVYFNIDKHDNKNPDYTWRNYIYDSIEKILSFSEFDVCINSDIIKERIKKYAPHLIPIKDYWWGKNYFRNKYWTFKSLKNYINIEELKKIILTSGEITFRINTSFVDIDLTKVFDICDLQLLGFEYTDGFWSHYDNAHCFDNKNKTSVTFYKKIMKKYSKNQRCRDKDWNKRDSLYTFGFGYINKYTLLMPFIYENDRTKNLDITLLSRLSFSQFGAFISGFIDGDGSVNKKEIRLCNFEKTNEGPKKLYNLFLKNGIFSFLNKNGIVISFEEYNKSFIESLNIQNSDRRVMYEQREYFKRKNTCSNKIGVREFDNYYVVRVESIEKLSDQLNMIDLETETSYFSCNGIKTHNCISFDLQYIFTRLPKIGIPQTSINQFSEFFIDGSRYISHMPGCVALDQDFLYRTFTFTKMENYKLGFIAAHELKGVTKIQLPLPFNQMYWKMLNKTIEYNIRDTDLLEQLDAKLAHINLLNELRIICNTSFDSVTSMGQIDSLMVSYLRKKGIASKNSNPHVKKEKYPGAYVFEPIPGTYDSITDFDFASLYPSIMITYNIGVNSYVMKLKDPHLGYELTYCPEKLPDKIKIILDPLYKQTEVETTRDDLLNKIKESKLVYTINGCFFLPHKKEFSFFGEVVDMLMVTRKDYKKKMFKAIEGKDKDEESFFYTRQLVYKVLANTLYGVVANKSFRFYDNSLAASITLSGQEILKKSIIEGDAFMKHLNTGKPYISPNPITKQEMFADPKTQPDIYYMPDRSRDYIITGDTDSIFCCFENFGENLKISEIHGYCNQVSEFLNEDKIIDIVKKHNVDLDFNRLKLKNELVISRGLFLAKKRYAIRVVNNEGKDVDKINYMGLEIKRSDYPRKSKEFLSELSELLLKSEKVSLNNLVSYVTRQEKEFLDLVVSRDKSISRPVSYGQNLEDYKVVSQGVKAMEAWNKIMYNIHKKGVKAYMYWVSGIDLDKAPVDVRENYHKFVKDGNKLEVIAIPDEEEKLPDYFIIDVKATMKFTFTDRHELLLKPLMQLKKSAVLTF